jgi:methionyl-tRNA formyltransferase
MSLRVVIVTRIAPVLVGFDAVVRGAGHEPVALMSMRDHDGRYGNLPDIGELVMSAAPELEVLLPASRSSIAPLLAAVEPDLVVCMGFPWKIPPDALRCRGSAGSTATRRCCRASRPAAGRVGDS